MTGIIRVAVPAGYMHINGKAGDAVHVILQDRNGDARKVLCAHGAR